jgi:hypothetical protein
MSPYNELFSKVTGLEMVLTGVPGQEYDAEISIPGGYFFNQ